MTTLGPVLRRFRKEKKYSQSDVAEMLGCSYQQVQQYENAKSIPPLPRLLHLIEILSIPPNLIIPNGNGKDYAASEDFFEKKLQQRITSAKPDKKSGKYTSKTFRDAVALGKLFAALPEPRKKMLTEVAKLIQYLPLLTLIW